VKTDFRANVEPTPVKSRQGRSRTIGRISVSPYALGLAFFMLLGLGLRLYGFSNGLPYIIPADESLIVDAGTHILKTGDPDPHQFFYPSFYIYLQTVVYALHFVWGSFTGLYQNIVKDWPDKTYDVTNAPGVYYWGRSLTILIGTAGIGLVYALVKLIWQDRRMALCAAGLLACSALAIEHSQYITVDLLLATLLLATLWPAWIIAEQGQRRGYIIFGLITGLAISTKWNAGLVLVLALTAHLLYLSGARRLRQFFNLNLLMLLAFTGLTTLASTPFALAEMRGYSNSFVANLEKYQLSTGSTASDTPWLSNLQVLWNDSAVLALLSLGGLILAVLHRNRRDLLLIVFPLVYLLSLNGLRLVYPRNVLPLTYFGVILAAFFISRVLAFNPLRRLIARRIGQGTSLPARERSMPVPSLVNAPRSVIGKRLLVWPNLKLETWNFILILGLVGLIMYAPVRNALYGGWFNGQAFSYQRVGEWLEREVGPGPLKLAELRPQQWPKGYPNLFAVRDDPKKEGNQADAHGLNYYRERGIAYLAINDDRAGPFLQSGKGNYFDLFSKGELVEKIQTREIAKPGPSFTIIATGVKPETLRLQHPLPVAFGPALNLLGFNLGKIKSENEIYLPAEGEIKSDWPIFKPGEIMGLSIYWQPQAKLELDYVIFIHLRPVGKPDLNVAARDTQPLLGAYPTSHWRPGEILTDNPNLALPADLAPGDYNLLMGLYATNQDGSLAPLLLKDKTNALNLGTLRVQK